MIKEYNRAAQKRFTFHYVSIKSRYLVDSKAGNTNLHSTMYLLNLDDLTNCPQNLWSFTFHYVSIKSVFLEVQSVPLTDLHSTMYLLNPVPQHLIISQAYFVLFCRPTIIHGNKICIHQKLSLFTA